MTMKPMKKKLGLMGRELNQNNNDIASPCVQSGYCCTVRPCAYGTTQKEYVDNGLKPVFGIVPSDSVGVEELEYKITDRECIYLAPPDDIGRRNCLAYKHIKDLDERMGNRFPMMGSGCSSPIGNNNRNEVLQKLLESYNNARNQSTLQSKHRPRNS